MPRLGQSKYPPTRPQRGEVGNCLFGAIPEADYPLTHPSTGDSSRKSRKKSERSSNQTAYNNIIRCDHAYIGQNYPPTLPQLLGTNKKEEQTERIEP